MRFSIIMPVLNEEAILASHLARLIHQCAHQDYELLLVDGGSTDRTVEIAQPYAQVLTRSSRTGTPDECRCAGGKRRCASLSPC